MFSKLSQLFSDSGFANGCLATKLMLTYLLHLSNFGNECLKYFFDYFDLISVFF